MSVISILQRLLPVLFLVAACTSAPASAPASTPAVPAAPAPGEQREEKQILRIGTAVMHPYPTPQANAAFHFLVWPMLDNRTQFGPNYELKPSVAEKWQLSADRLTWTLTIRKDMTFANGDPLTS